jgi:hypothetical protein
MLLLLVALTDGLMWLVMVVALTDGLMWLVMVVALTDGLMWLVRVVALTDGLSWLVMVVTLTEGLMWLIMGMTLTDGLIWLAGFFNFSFSILICPLVSTIAQTTFFISLSINILAFAMSDYQRFWPKSHILALKGPNFGKLQIFSLSLLSDFRY